MSIHLRRWGLAIGLMAAFAVPQLATQAQDKPVVTTPATVSPTGTLITLATASPAAAANEVLTLRITAYTSLADQTDNTPFITADGSYVHDGVVATNLLPFGTKVMIPSLFGDKVFTVDDRMNRKFMHNMDIWMSSESKAIVFGVHLADVIVLGQGADIGMTAAANADSVALANATFSTVYPHGTPRAI